MQIDAISVRIPSFEVSNEWAIDELERLNPDLPPKTLKLYQRQTLSLLKKSGSQTRFWRDKQKGETAFELTRATMVEALQKANLKKDDIDLLIYCGVGKGFKEPANAYFFAAALDMTCSCFDITDACMSWTRALDIAYRFLKAGKYRHIMVVTGEFNVYEHLYPYLWKIKSLSQTEYTLPAYTIGEAATTTVLSSSESEWKFDYDSAPQLVNLCTIPTEGYEEFCESDPKINLHGINRFVSFGSELFAAATESMITLVKRTIKNVNDPDIWFSHAASSAAYLEAGDILGLRRERNYIDVYPRFGNVVSSSIPLAMHMAQGTKRLKRGDKVVLWPTSAGMVYALVQFIY